MPSPIRIKSVDSAFERQPLIRPFGFKGIYQREFWVSAALLESASGLRHAGIMTQCVAWSDLDVFLAHSEAAGNMLLHATLERALQEIKGTTFTTPMDLQEAILAPAHAFARTITGRGDHLRKTFTLSALVALDNAAWMLYAQENGLRTFDAMIPEPYRAALSHRHAAVAHIPLMAYAVPIDEIVKTVREGWFFIKIKIRFIR